MLMLKGEIDAGDSGAWKLYGSTSYVVSTSVVFIWNKMVLDVAKLLALCWVMDMV